MDCAAEPRRPELWAATYARIYTQKALAERKLFPRAISIRMKFDLWLPRGKLFERMKRSWFGSLVLKQKGR
jgi:hypothetical protein